MKVSRTAFYICLISLLSLSSGGLDFSPFKRVFVNPKAKEDSNPSLPLPPPPSPFPSSYSTVIDLRDVLTNLANKIVSLSITYLTFQLVARGVKAAVEEIWNKTANPSATLTDSLPGNFSRYLQANVTLTHNELELASSLILPSGIVEDWRAVGGMSMMKHRLLDLLDYSEEHWESMRQGKGRIFTHIRSILFFGPPGCGKSMLINALCKKIDVPLIRITPSLLLRKYVGETSQLIHALFTLARKMQPMVIFVDEIDALFRSRFADDCAVERHLKTEFMQLWDGLATTEADVLIIGATNRPQDLDPAVQRRFERSFLLSLPDEESRLDIFRKALASVPKEKGFDFSLCSRLTEGYASSDIAMVCKAAVRQMEKESRQKQPSGTGTGALEPKARPLLSQDVRKVLETFYPTSWTSRAYGSYSDQPSPPQYPSSFPSSDEQDYEEMEDWDED